MIVSAVDQVTAGEKGQAGRMATMMWWNVVGRNWETREGPHADPVRLNHSPLLIPFRAQLGEGF